jgi:hypothetical protein
MIFNKRRVSPNSSEVPSSSNRRHRRYLACMYNYLISVKAAFQDYNTYKNNYDPYQMKQYADESQFDPYQNNQQVDKTEIEMIINEDSSCSSSSSSDDETVTNDHYYLPPTKRFRTMASTVVDHAAQAVLYGTFAAFNFVWSEKKNLGEYYFQEKKKKSHFDAYNTQVEQQQPQPPYKKQKVVTMRGFGVDFVPFIERPAALQSRMDNAEKNIRDICLRTKESVHDAVVSKTINSYGGNQLVPSKRTFDDTWGFVDNDLSVNFKVGILLILVLCVLA